MCNSDPQHRFCAAAHAIQWMLRAGAVVLLLGFSAGPRPAWAQPPAPPKPPAPAAAPKPAAPDRQALHDALAAKYEVLPVRNGVLLKPRTVEAAVRAVEVSGDTLAVNGEPVSEGVLRAWLGEQAEPVLRLHRLPPAERQALFGLKAGAGSTGEQEIPDTKSGEGAGASSTAPAQPADTAKAADTEEESAVSTTPGETPEAESSDTAETPTAVSSNPGSGSSSGSRVKLFGGITVAKDEVTEQAVAVLGSVRVEGQVAQDAVAVGGSVVVDGKVGGNVVAVGGSVHLGPHAEVMGDVTSVGGTIDREEGSKVHGSTEDVGVGGSRHWRRDIDVDTGFWPLFRSMDLIWKLISLVLLSLLVFLCLLMARRQVERAEYHVITEPWKAGLVGFLAQLLFLPLLLVVTVLLAITIVGCALYLLYPFLFVGIVLAALVGFTAVAHELGHFLEERFHRRFGSPYAVALMGVVTIEIWTILGHMVGLGGGFLHLIALVIVVFGAAMKYAAWTVGFGSVILARLNRTPAGWPGSNLAGTSPPAVPAPMSPMPPASPEGPGPAAALPLSEHWDEEERRWEETDGRHWEEPPPKV
jgi:cytoskeletal protein CcmA (bactofilin family)